MTATKTYNITNWPDQCFILADDLIHSITPADIEATFADMVELNIAEPPYREFQVRLPVQNFLRVKGQENLVSRSFDKNQMGVFIFRVISESNVSVVMGLPYRNESKLFFDPVVMLLDRYGEYCAGLQDALESTEGFGKYLYRALIVLLATRNIEKVTREHKLYRFVKPKPGEARVRYSTTLSIGKVIEPAESEGAPVPGRTVRPHLRRGHIRRQRFGPNFEQTKRVFIQPVFVNADEGWCATRTHYNVSL